MTFDDRPVRHSDHHALDTQAVRPDSQTDAPDDIDENAQTGKKQTSMVREIVETLLLALIIFVAVRAVVLNFRVDGLSMMPSLQNNEMLLVNRNAYFNFDTWALVDWLPLVEHEEENVVYPFDPPERGDVIVFNAPVNGADQPYIKRVIGLPGETVEIHDNGVYINGQRLDEEYLGGEDTWCGRPGQPCETTVVPEGTVFVLGDNRDNSSDSPDFGPVPVDSIIGKAWVTYWPKDVIGVVPHYEYPELTNQE